MTHKEYNGWTNYETWLVKLWMDNDEGSYDYWRHEAADCVEYDRSVSHLANSIKESHESALPELEGFAADLMNAALSEVNWSEIANSLIEDWKAEHKEETT